MFSSVNNPWLVPKARQDAGDAAHEPEAMTMPGMPRAFAAGHGRRKLAAISWQRAWLGSIVVGAALLSGCNRADDGRTTGQRVDAAIASTEKTTGELAADTKKAVDKAGRVVARTGKDISITAEVNAALARDEALSPLAINVDTENGHVLLKGSAPTDQDRERAATIAKATAGVVSVDNQLQIKTVN